MSCQVSPIRSSARLSSVRIFQKICEFKSSQKSCDDDDRTDADIIIGARLKVVERAGDRGKRAVVVCQQVHLLARQQSQAVY